MKLDDMQKLCDEATPGSWFFDSGNIVFYNDGLKTSLVCHKGLKRNKDGEFIAVSRENAIAIEIHWDCAKREEND